MLRALLWKEWRQLRLLRWGGAALGFVLPPLLLLAAEGARKGWLPLSSLSTYSARTVLTEAAPLMSALFIWPLLALMFTAQAFAADRAEGTEAFVLERPIPRIRIWQARLLAAAGTTVVVLAIHGLIWWLAARVSGGGGPAPSQSVMLETSQNILWRDLGSIYLAGGALTVVAFLAGMVAACLVRSPMQGVLLGIVLTLVPAGVATVLGVSFPGISLANFHLGWVFSGLIVVGYLVASILVDCRGEPAGRGRLRRGLAAIGVSVIAVPLLMATTAPPVMRWDARWGLGNPMVFAAPDGSASVVANNYQGAGWLVDSVSAGTVRFLPPRVIDAAWSPDGRRVAVVHSAGAMGRSTRHPKIDIFDRKGGRTRPTIDCPECTGFSWPGRGADWVGENVVVRGGSGLVLVSATTGARRTVAIDQPDHTWVVVSPVEADGLFVFRLEWPEGQRRRPLHGDALLQPIDLARGDLGPAVRIPGVDTAWFARKALSPSGRYWIRPKSDTWPGSILELASGREYPLRGHAVWLVNDILARGHRTDERFELSLGPPGATRVVRTWTRSVVMLDASPDGRRLLVRVYEKGSDLTPKVWIYEPEADTWQEVPPVAETVVQWAGPSTLALSSPGLLALYDPADDSVRYVIGAPPS